MRQPLPKLLAIALSGGPPFRFAEQGEFRSYIVSNCPGVVYGRVFMHLRQRLSDQLIAPIAKGEIVNECAGDHFRTEAGSFDDIRGRFGSPA